MATALIATAARSLKTVLQQTALAEGAGPPPAAAGDGGRREDAASGAAAAAAGVLAGSVALNYYVSQYTAVMLGVEALVLEPEGFLHASSVPLGVWGLLAAGGLFAYLANLLNYVLTSMTSALTLQVGG